MRRRWKVLVACTPAIVIQGLDLTMINLALPSMGVALSAQLADLQWVVAAFALAMVSLLPTSAAIGDLYGRRRALLIGYAMLAPGMALAWSATSIAVLLLGRVAQGIGMALGAPNSFAMVALSFPEGERGRALGLWTGISAVAFTISPVAGGWLVESFGFNAVFAPLFFIALIGGLGTLMWMPADPPRDRGRLDLIGMALATGAVSLLSYGSIEGGRAGFGRPLIMAALAIGLLCAGWFIRHELRGEVPMLDLRLIRRPPFGQVLVASFTLNAATGTLIFFLTIYLQALRGLSPWATAYVMLAYSGLALIGAPAAGYFTDRRGFRLPVGIAVPAVGVSALLMSLAGRGMPETGYLLVAMGLAGAVHGAFFVRGGQHVSRAPDIDRGRVAVGFPPSRKRVRDSRLRCAGHAGGPGQVPFRDRRSPGCRRAGLVDELRRRSRGRRQCAGRRPFGGVLLCLRRRDDRDRGVRAGRGKPGRPLAAGEERREQWAARRFRARRPWRSASGGRSFWEGVRHGMTSFAAEAHWPECRRPMVTVGDPIEAGPE